MVLYSKLHPVLGLNFLCLDLNNEPQGFSWTGVERPRPHQALSCPLPLGNPYDFEKLYILLLCIFLSLEAKFPIKVLPLGANGKYFIINKFNLLSALH